MSRHLLSKTRYLHLRGQCKKNLLACVALVVVSEFASRYSTSLNKGGVPVPLHLVNKQVFFSPTSGLGNSMLALISARHFAALMGAQFGVIWDENTSPSCQAPFKDLFSPPRQDTDILGCNGTCPLDLTQRGSPACWHTITCGSRFDIEQLFTSCPCVHILSNQFFLPAISGHISRVPHAKVLQHTAEYFRPSAPIAHRVARTLRDWKTSNRVTHSIGVHVRASHNNEGVQNGQWIAKKNTFRNIFWPCLKDVLSSLTDERVGVFVAADIPEVRDEASSLLSREKRAVELPTPIDDLPNDSGLGPHRSTQEVLDAAVELFLLKSSDSLLVKKGNTFDSTFSATAALLAGCETGTACYLVDDSKCERALQPIIPDFHLEKKIDCDNYNQISEPCVLEKT